MKAKAAAILAVFAHTLSAQTPAPSPTPPQPPLLRRAPEKSQWLITYKLEVGAPTASGTAGEQAPKRPPVRKLIIKNEGMILEKTVNGNGVSFDAWHTKQGITLTSVGGKNWIIAPPLQPGFDTADYTTQDFAGFDWITPQNFVGAKVINGRRCLVFEDRVVTLEPSELRAIESDIGRDLTWADLPGENKDPALQTEPRLRPKRRFFRIEDYKSPVAAYIDDQTRLPMALIYKTPAGSVTRTFEYQSAPPLLELPAEAQAVIKENVQRQQRLSVPHAPI